MTGSIFLEADTFSVAEPDGTVLVTIRRSGDSSGAVEVEYGTNSDTAIAGQDFVLNNGFATIPAGENSVTVPIQIVNDGTSEDTETFNVSLVNVDSGQLQFPRTARIDILDDENPVTPEPTPDLVSDFDVVSEVVITGLDEAVGFEFFPDDPSKVLVTEIAGQLRVYDLDTNSFQDEPFLDIRDQVNSAGDRGLLDVAFHPDYPAEPYIYAFYVVDPADTATATGSARQDGDGNRFAYVSRFTVEENNGNLNVVDGSEDVLVGGGGQSLADISGNGAINSTSTANASVRASDVDPDTGEFVQDYIKIDSVSHAGGSLAFGPDGALYISTGDGVAFDFADARARSVQSVDALAGKILRVDPETGDGLADNPFAAAANSLSDNVAKVYQLGLRNPFSIGFNEDGQLFISDTGWFSFEEINAGEPGANFGWPYWEGGVGGILEETPGFRDTARAQSFYDALANGQFEITAPFQGFSHANADPGFQVQTIVGADDVYTGDVYPEELQNHYFFTDVSQGEVFAINTNDRRDVKFLFTTEEGFGPVHLKQGPDGFVYYADFITGEIGRYLITPNDGAVTPNRVIDNPNSNDTLNGSTPNDIFVIDASASEYEANLSEDGSGIVVYTSAQGDNVFDVLFGFETIEFNDSSLDLSPFFNTSSVVQDNPDITQILTGSANDDRFVINANSNQYQIGDTQDGNGAVVYTTDPNDSVFDILFGFEFVEFNDRTINLDEPTGTVNRVQDNASQNENLTGTTNNDVFVIDGSIQDYSANLTESRQGIVVYTDAPNDGVFDLLFGFEAIEFNDGSINTAPFFEAGPIYQDDPRVNQNITGTTSNDRFVINGNSTDYGIGPNQSGGGVVVFTLAPNDDVYDILFGFESVQFNDQSIDVSGGAPSLAAADDGLMIA